LIEDLLSGMDQQRHSRVLPRGHDPGRYRAPSCARERHCAQRASRARHPRRAGPSERGMQQERQLARRRQPDCAARGRPASARPCRAVCPRAAPVLAPGNQASRRQDPWQHGADRISLKVPTNRHFQVARPCKSSRSA
jgi:hypothetical protein